MDIRKFTFKSGVFNVSEIPTPLIPATKMPHTRVQERLSRRRFIQFGAGAVAIVLLGWSGFKLLQRQQAQNEIVFCNGWVLDVRDLSDGSCPDA